MVRSAKGDNFYKHLIDVYTEACKRTTQINALKFVDYYCEVYEPHQKNFIGWDLAFTLYDEKKRVQRIGTRWYACLLKYWPLSCPSCILSI